MTHKWQLFVFLLALLPAVQCRNKTADSKLTVPVLLHGSDTLLPPVREFYLLKDTVLVRGYFPFMDQLVDQLDSSHAYPLSEHQLVRYNPWLLDTLANTDYYRRMERGEFVYDQRRLPVLFPGDTLYIPDSLSAQAIQAQINRSWLDINIPEFRLRVVDSLDTLFTFPVRAGQNKSRYQAELNRVADLRTRTGRGTIVRINRAPDYFTDPHTGKRFTTTLRDDGRRTKMPLVPWLEPEINGVRLGQMIHPTTNPGSLEKPYSNGCIGCNEADAWYIYYFAPLGTRVVIRYDTQVVLANGDTLNLPDIYEWNRKQKI
ncbi:MAG: L,D-transpeptidase [Lewinellaceae bacterium]|nr:L,D-transpeptidase [Lewinellaceae bacterium]